MTPEQKQQRVEDVCTRVAEGETLRQIAAHYGCTSGNVIRWCTETKEFTEQYARAREAAADLFENDIYDAAMSSIPETAQSDRLKVDALKWIAARRSPKKYGDRVDHVSSDGTMSPKGKSLSDFYADDVPAKS